MVGALGSNAVNALAFAILCCSFRNTVIYLLVDSILIQFLKFCIQCLLFLLMVGMKSIDEPLHSRAFFTCYLLHIATQAGNHYIHITYSSQNISQLFPTSIDLLKCSRI